MDCNNKLVPFVPNNLDLVELISYPESNSDVFSLIFSNLDLPSLRTARCICQNWKRAASVVNVSKLVTYNTLAFGPDQWAKHMGKVATDEEIRAALSILPANIEKILCSPCPVFPGSGKLVKDTHVLVYIDQSVGRTAIILTSSGELLEAKLDGSNRKNKGFEYIHPEVLSKLNKPVDQAHWVLMTKDVLGGDDLGPNGSRGKAYATQEKMVEELAERSGELYEVPQTLEAVAALIAHFLKSGKFIFGRGDDLWTYTRCKEELINGYRVGVGGFASAGLSVNGSYDFAVSGVAGLRKFF